VTLLTYYGGPRDEAYERDVAREFPGAVTVCTGTTDGPAAVQALHYLSRLPSRAPYAVTRFTHREVRRLVAERLADTQLDAAVCDFLAASLNFPHPLPKPAVLFQHNVESALWRRRADAERHPARRAVYRIEARKMERYERAAVARFHHVIAVSEHDRALMAAMTEPSRLSVVPTGVDVSRYRALVGREAVGPLVLFLGSMDWEPNVDAVEYFCGDIWPRVRRAVPEARFRIVGRRPHPRVRRLASDSVEVTGTVPSVLEHLEQTAVFVVPLRVGGGTRLKIFEAMAAGRGVVSTTVGAEGLDVRHGRDLLLADDAETFADHVVTLLGDRHRRRRLERAAAELASRYDWPVITRQFESVLEAVRTSAP
jgi:glycosyltransferase involved in cell wall biosynthesis